MPREVCHTLTVRCFALVVLSVHVFGCATGGDDPVGRTRDTGSADTSPRDTDIEDTSAADAGGFDTDSPDTASPDTGPPDTASPDTGSPDTSSPDTPDTAPPPRLTCDAASTVTAPEPIAAWNFTRDASDVAPRAPNVPLSAEGAALVSGGEAVLTGGRLIASVAASDSLSLALRASSFTVEIFVRASDLVVEESFPPERMFTLSQTSTSRLLTIGAQESSLVVRLRSTLTDANGAACVGSDETLGAQMIVPGVFTASGGMKHVVFVFDATTGRPSVFINGEFRETSYCAGRATLNWGAGYRFLIGDELSGGRAFDGRVGRVAVYDRALSPSEIRCWSDAGESAPIEL